MIEYWHNPRCSKSRQGLALLEENGADLKVRRYLEDAPTLAELTAAWEALGKPPVVQMMRPREAAFKQAGLSREDADEDLLSAMAAHPVLIERPLALRDGRAVIGRPPEALLDLL
ncbi:arsenate reductase (glutaredoxin) [Pseudooceanicola sp.]|uniref:arsenate reductase (glutaredoxin) n=1 Tax=Pseudooceanicola sp. TaxID=1914328 RepID=UPI0035134319